MKTLKQQLQDKLKKEGRAEQQYEKLMGKLAKKLPVEEQEINPKILKRIHLRKELSCDFCKPNRNENAKRRPKHGRTKPKSKNKRA